MWGNSRCLSRQETVPKEHLFGNARSGKRRQSNGLFCANPLVSGIIFGPVVIGQCVLWRRKILYISEKQEQKHLEKTTG
jgi:hypothetical protein